MWAVLAMTSPDKIRVGVGTLRCEPVTFLLKLFKDTLTSDEVLVVNAPVGRREFA